MALEDVTDVRTSAVERCPAEVWLEIFELVPQSTDLHGVSVACRKFRDLTVRTLHRDVLWRFPLHVAHNLPVWAANDDPDMGAAVRSFVLGVSAHRPGQTGRIVQLDGTAHKEGPYSAHTQEITQRKGREEEYASAPLHDAMFARLRTFVNIHSLTLINVFVQEAHFAFIHSLPHLRVLSLEGCSFDGQPVQTCHNAGLPIEELTMVDMKRDEEVSVVTEERFAYALSLCTAKGLKSLTIDSTADVFRMVYNRWDAQTRGWLVPTELERIFVLRRRSGKKKSSPGNAGEITFPDTYLYRFCVQTPTLKTISTPILVPSQVTVAPEALPLNLERFAAPLETAQLVAAVRDIEALGLLKCGIGARETVAALTNIAMFRQGLKMLRLELRSWDGEVMSAVVQLFKELRRLKVTYEASKPSEDFLVALAPDYLVKLPELHTLELYELHLPRSRRPKYPRYLFDPSYESVEEELRNMVIPWNKYCPKLRRVQLHAGYVMTRAFEGTPWCLERVRRYEDKDELGY